MSDRHVRVTDLPGYLTPATIAEIPDFPGSYGFVWINGGMIALTPPALAQDSAGRLWANPKTYLMSDEPDDDRTWAAVAWTETGLGVFVPPHSYPAIARRRFKADYFDGWIPAVEVLPSAPNAAEADA